MKNDRALMKHTRVNAELSGVFPEVFRTRIRRENAPDGPPPLIEINAQI